MGFAWEVELAAVGSVDWGALTVNVCLLVELSVLLLANLVVATVGTCGASVVAWDVVELAFKQNFRPSVKLALVIVVERCCWRWAEVVVIIWDSMI